ncbi:hypothetical protein SLS61_006389 [Didymella pomorum]
MDPKNIPPPHGKIECLGDFGIEGPQVLVMVGSGGLYKNPRTLNLKGDRPDAIRIILQIGTPEFPKLPKKLDFLDLVRLAEAAARWDSHAMLAPFIDEWVAPWRARTFDPRYEQWLYIAHELGWEDDYLKLSRHLATHCSVDAQDRLLALDGTVLEHRVKMGKATIYIDMSPKRVLDKKALEGRRWRKVPEVSSALNTDTDSKYMPSSASIPGTDSDNEDVLDIDPAPGTETHTRYVPDFDSAFAPNPYTGDTGDTGDTDTRDVFDLDSPPALEANIRDV